MRTFGIVIALVVILSPLAAHGQEEAAAPPELWRVEVEDGSVIVGSIAEEDSSCVVVVTLSGLRTEIPRATIISIERVHGKLVGKRLYRQDPNYTRLFFAPTGRALRQGEGYVADYWIFFPFVGTGVGGGITLSGGLSLFPGASSQIFYLAPKLTLLENENVSIAAGLIHFGVTGVNNGGGAGILYTVGTFGDPYRSFTAGLGWGYAGSDVGNRPVVMVGGDTQVSRGMKLLCEWWLPPGGDVSLLGFGARMFGERLSWDFAFLSPVGVGMGGGFPFVPWLGVSYSFGARKS